MLYTQVMLNIYDIYSVFLILSKIKLFFVNIFIKIKIERKYCKYCNLIYNVVRQRVKQKKKKLSSTKLYKRLI